jgi:hypothetical protein
MAPTIQLFGNRVEGDWTISLDKWASQQYVKSCYTNILSREKFAIMNRQKHGETLFIEPRSILYILTNIFNNASHLNDTIATVALGTHCFPAYADTWNLKTFEEAITNMLNVTNLWPIDRLSLLLVYHFAQRFENEIATNIAKAKRPNIVFVYTTFYLWLFDKILQTLTGLAPTMIKNRISNYLKRFPHQVGNNDGEVTFQLEDIIPVLSWLEKEGRASQIDPHPIRDMSGAGSSHNGYWTDPASSSFDASILPWFYFCGSLDIQMVKFDNILDNFLKNRYGTKTIPREGLEFWRAFGSLDTESFDIFSPQNPDSNLNGGVPAGEDTSKVKKFDMKVFSKVELLLNFNTAGEDGGYADNGDRPVFVSDLVLWERVMGMDNQKTWYAPTLLINASGTPTSTNYNTMISGITNQTLLQLDPNSFHNLETMMETNRNNLKVISANMGAQFKLIKDAIDEVSLQDFIKNGLNGGSESPEKRPELAEFFKLESTVSSLMRQGQIGNADYLAHPFRMNWYTFEGLFNNQEANDKYAHDLLYVYDKVSGLNVPAYDVFWHPKLYKTTLSEDPIGSSNDKFYYLKSFIDNYVSHVPKSLQFTMIYLLGKTGDFYIDPDDTTNLSGSLNKNGTGTKPTAVIMHGLLNIGKAGGGEFTGLTQTGGSTDTTFLAAAGSNNANNGQLDIATNDIVNSVRKGEYLYPLMVFETYIDGYNYRNLGVGNSEETQETRRYRVARTTHDNMPDAYTTGGSVLPTGSLGTALAFEEASWSFCLKSFVDEVRPVYYTKRTISVERRAALYDESMFEMLYSWYDRYAIKRLFPGLFSFGLPNTTLTTLRTTYEMLFRPRLWNATERVPSNEEAWINEVTADEWIKDVEYVSKVLPKIYEPIQDFISLADQV